MPDVRVERAWSDIIVPAPEYTPPKGFEAFRNRYHPYRLWRDGVLAAQVLLRLGFDFGLGPYAFSWDFDQTAVNTREGQKLRNIGLIRLFTGAKVEYGSSIYRTFDPEMQRMHDATSRRSDGRGPRQFDGRSQTIYAGQVAAAAQHWSGDPLARRVAAVTQEMRALEDHVRGIREQSVNGGPLYSDQERRLLPGRGYAGGPFIPAAQEAIRPLMVPPPLPAQGLYMHFSRRGVPVGFFSVGPPDVQLERIYDGVQTYGLAEPSFIIIAPEGKQVAFESIVQSEVFFTYDPNIFAHFDDSSSELDGMHTVIDQSEVAKRYGVRFLACNVVDDRLDSLGYDGRLLIVPQPVQGPVATADWIGNAMEDLYG